MDGVKTGRGRGRHRRARRDPGKSGRPAAEPTNVAQGASGATPAAPGTAEGRPTATTSGRLPVLYFDFVDPASHLIGHLLDRAAPEAAVEWRPLELAPPPAPLIDPASGEWRGRVAEARAAGAPPGLAIESPALLPWTRKAHELCELARDRGLFHELRRAIFRAHFAGNVDIGRIDLLAEIADRAGLDRTEARAALDVDRYADRIARARTAARRQGVRTVPTLVPGGLPGGLLAGPRGPEDRAEGAPLGALAGVREIARWIESRPAGPGASAQG